MITFTRGSCSLEDSQILGLNHALMQEGQHSVVPTRDQWINFIDSTIDSFQRGHLPLSRGSRDPIPRLQAARREIPSAQRFYAAERLLRRAQGVQITHRSYLERYAQNFNVEFAVAELEFALMLADATEDPTLCASPAFIRVWESNPENAGLLVDRRSQYAYEQMEVNRSSRNLQVESRPAVTHSPVDSSWISTMGYDPLNGRFEITSIQNPDTIYAYRMSPIEYEEFLDAEGSLGTKFASMVRNNPSMQYEDSFESEMESVHNRCLTCGQYSGINHYCPIVGSEESINNDIRLAIERATASIAENVTAPVPHTLLRGRTTLYNADYNGSPIAIRIPSISRLTAEARRANSVRIPVLATFNSNEQGFSISGLATVSYDGRGRGYHISPVTEDSSSGENNLRCSCAQYLAQNTCEHLAIVSERISSLARGNSRPSAQTVRDAIATIQVELEAEYAESLRATQEAEATWSPIPISFEQDPTIFQELYNEFKTKRQEYKDAITSGADINSLSYPVPYIEENAFGGLARRGSKRGFGTEIEFSFPGDMDYMIAEEKLRAIGRDLHAAGLTASSRQRGYGATHGRYVAEHAGGWSFEQDGTTGYRNEAISGGEIVSPVMFDEPETWINLKKVCEILKNHGAIASRGAGSHVHVGVGDYDHRVENHNRLLQAYSENEDLLYRLSANPERGRHRGRGYCAPNRVASTPYVSVNTVQGEQGSHGNALNLYNVTGRSKDHAEFRTFDSSLNPSVIQAQIGFAVYLAEGGLRADGSTLPRENRTPLGSRVSANPDREPLTGEQWRESTKGIRRFIDRFIPGVSEEDQSSNPRIRQMVALFAMTRWQGNRSRTSVE